MGPLEHIHNRLSHLLGRDPIGGNNALAHPWQAGAGENDDHNGDVHQRAALRSADQRAMADSASSGPTGPSHPASAWLGGPGHHTPMSAMLADLGTALRYPLAALLGLGSSPKPVTSSIPGAAPSLATQNLGGLPTQPTVVERPLANVLNAIGSVFGNTPGATPAVLSSTLGNLGALAATIGQTATAIARAALAAPGYVPPAANALATTSMTGTPAFFAAMSSLVAQATAAAGLSDRASLAAHNALQNAATPMPARAPTPAMAATAANVQNLAAIPVPGRTAEVVAPMLPARSELAGRVGTTMANAPAGVTTTTAVPAGTTVAAAEVRTPTLPAMAPQQIAPASQSPPVPGRAPGAGDHGAAGTTRAEHTVPAGFTNDAPARQRRNRPSLADAILPARLARLLRGRSATDALNQGAIPNAAAGESSSPWLRLLFWALTIIGYGCLLVAVLVLLPGGSGFLDETRNPAGQYALVVGLAASISAWWLGRRLARS